MSDSLIRDYLAAAEANYLPPGDRRVRRWPSPEYLHDPIRFAVEQLGIAPTAQQAEFIAAVMGHDLVVVPAGRATGKSVAIAMLALWNYASHQKCVTFLSGPCQRQIDEIVFTEIRGMLADQRCLRCRVEHPEARGAHCEHVTPLDCEVFASAQHGVRSADNQRRVFGAAPKDAQSARGIASPVGMLAMIDETSGVDREVIDAIRTNALSRGGKFAALGNPAVLHDAFWEMCQSSEFARVHMSALRSPNVVLGRTVVQGLANVKFVEDARATFGERDSRWRVDILGEFPLVAAATLVSPSEFGEACRRYEAWEQSGMRAEGAIWIGIDPAHGGGGDDTVIVYRRGDIVLELSAFQGGVASILDRVLQWLAENRQYPTEAVDVNFDESSEIGASLRTALQHAACKDEHIRWHGLSSRGNIDRRSVLYGRGYARPRDAYWGNMALRLQKSVAVAFNADLRDDLLTAEWRLDRESSLKELISKNVHKRRLKGRSPDCGDALSYCLYEGHLESYAEYVPVDVVTPVVPIRQSVVSAAGRYQAGTSGSCLMRPARAAVRR